MLQFLMVVPLVVNDNLSSGLDGYMDRIKCGQLESDGEVSDHLFLIL